MRFIGNKEKIVERLYHSLTKRGITGNTFFDFFAGTASVGRFFKKKGYEVFSSDILYFSYCLQKAYIENNNKPQFVTLRNFMKIEDYLLFSSPLEIILNYLNSLEPVEGFIYQNYSPGGTAQLHQPRMYLSDENAKKIDAIRGQIEDWYLNKRVTESEYFILLACLIESVSLFANVAGVYAAFQKKWDPRALKKFELKPIEIMRGDKNNKVSYGNSMELLPSIETDILYLDPPYNTRQYAPNYHLIETIACYDNPKIYGITGMRPYEEQKSSFCNKEKALEDLDFIASTAHYKYLILSYNSEGIMPQNAIKATLENYGALDIDKFEYPRFKSHSHSEDKLKKQIFEYIYILASL
ncbi:MAG: DNA methyltransferase [Candidatus Tokpelaia sp.]|nr:MAG: DNA methyltransferase [Candidatus Tokpelaia sp.]KAA6207329.1 MAG: DNA methyltransferase [Candidatus Tokpelaia sp.]